MCTLIITNIIGTGPSYFWPIIHILLIAGNVNLTIQKYDTAESQFSYTLKYVYMYKGPWTEPLYNPDLEPLYNLDVKWTKIKFHMMHQPHHATF